MFRRYVQSKQGKAKRREIKELLAGEAYLILDSHPRSLSIGAHWVCVESAYKDFRADFYVLKKKSFSTVSVSNRFPTCTHEKLYLCDDKNRDKNCE
jgi:hypothetical protein